MTDTNTKMPTFIDFPEEDDVLIKPESDEVIKARARIIDKKCPNCNIKTKKFKFDNSIRDIMGIYCYSCEYKF